MNLYKNRHIKAIIITLMVSFIIALLSIHSVYANDKIASGTCGDNLTWNIDSTGKLTINGTGDMTSFSSEGPWYEYWTDIDSIVISEGVKSIGDNAFKNCSLAESISIPKSLKKIGLYAFSGCEFRKVYISDLKSYLSFEYQYVEKRPPTAQGADLYLNGVLVENLVIPEGITRIPRFSFSGCTSIKSVTIPEGVTSIDGYAFGNCTNIREFSFPKSLSEINEHAFSGINNVEKLFISDLTSYLQITYETDTDPLTALGADLYINKVKVDTIVIPEEITNIGYNVLRGCSAREIVIPGGVKSIGVAAFADCKNLRSLTIPDSVRTIGLKAFAGCSNLTTISIQNGVKSIGEIAFGGCSNLDNVIIPDSVTKVGGGAFQECCNLTSIVLPSGLTEVEGTLFSGCTKLRTITIPNGVTTIGEWAFYNCRNLQSIYIPESVTSMHFREDEDTSKPFYNVNGAFYVKKDSFAEQYLTGEGKVVKYSCFGNHIWEDIYTVDTEPTCITDGLESKHCKRCDEVTGVTAIPAMGHKAGDWQEVSPPSCESTGLKVRCCENCNQVMAEETIPPTGHKAGNWQAVSPPSCESTGLKVRYCEICQSQIEEEKIPAQGHKIDSGWIVYEPSCGRTGLIRYRCEHCYNMIKEETIPATGKHSWDNGVITREANTTQTGIKTFTCTVCNAKMTETIPVIKPESTPVVTPGNDSQPAEEQTNIKGKDGTALGEGASAELAEKAIFAMKNDNDPKGSFFGKLQLKSTVQTKNSVKLQWKKVKGANKYVIYGNACGKKNKMKKLAIVKGKVKNFKKIAGKKVKKGTYYKFIVVAIDGNNRVVSSSKMIHVATKGGKVGNPKSLIVKAKVGKKVKAVGKATVKKGKSLKLITTVKPFSKKLKVKKHVAPRYESSNTMIATVNAKGILKAKKKGKCKVYVYAQNGRTRIVTIIVK